MNNLRKEWREKESRGCFSLILICQKGKNTHTYTHSSQQLSTNSLQQCGKKHKGRAGFYTAGLALMGPRCVWPCWELCVCFWFGFYVFFYFELGFGACCLVYCGLWSLYNAQPCSRWPASHCQAPALVLVLVSALRPISLYYPVLRQ